MVTNKRYVNNALNRKLNRVGQPHIRYVQYGGMHGLTDKKKSATHGHGYIYNDADQTFRYKGKSESLPVIDLALDLYHKGKEIIYDQDIIIQALEDLRERLWNTISNSDDYYGLVGKVYPPKYIFDDLTLGELFKTYVALKFYFPGVVLI
jgi:hypothetical protein